MYKSNESALANNNIAPQTSNEVPCNIEAERAVLGVILNNNENIYKVIDFLVADHFYGSLHRKIFDVIFNYVEKGMVANPITLKSHFSNDTTLGTSNIESFDYLLNLSSNATSIVNLVPFAKQIYETALRRNLISIGQETILDAHDSNVSFTAQEIFEKAEQKLFNLALQWKTESSIKEVKATVNEAITRIELARKKGTTVKGTSTGFIDLDKILSGMQDSDLLILASRPSMGKTSLAVNIALSIAQSFMKEDNKKNKSVAIFSLEMSSDQLTDKLLSIRTGINNSKIRTGSISEEEFQTLLNERKAFNNIPIFIDDTPMLSISSLRIRARRMKRQNNLGLLIVDYLQLLKSVGNSSNRVQEIGEISQGLKSIAKELNIPVLALSQLSRAVESREDKRPQLSDLRESGNIEQDADVVMFLYREEYYLAGKQPPVESDRYSEWHELISEAKGIAEVIVAKHRNGPIGNACLGFDNKTTSFKNLA